MRQLAKKVAIVLAGALCASASAQDRVDPVPAEIPVALMVDLSTGQTLYAREPTRRFVPASVTKVMTAYTAFKLIDEGALRTNARFLYTQELEDEWYAEGSNMFLKAGERPTIGELLLGVTTISGNDASVALAIAATGSLDKWLALMNRNAADLGMRDTHFGSANGFPDNGKTFTSAADLAILGEAITTRYPGLYRRYFGHHGLTWREVTQANHDPVTGRVEGADGMKTGYTREAGFTFLGSGERGGRRLVFVLAGAPSSPIRDQAARSFLEWGFEAFDSRRLLPADIVVGEALVQDGARTRVPLRLERDARLTLPKGRKGAIGTTIVYRGPIAAPIEKGAQIARLRVTVDGRHVHDIPLVAAEPVPQANLFQRVFNGFSGWLA